LAREIGIYFFVGNILLRYPAVCQANPTPKKADFRAYLTRVEARQTAFKDHLGVLRLRAYKVNKERI